MARKRAQASDTSDTDPPGAATRARAAIAGQEDFACLGYVGCLRYCLEQRGEKRSQTFIMGISGETFRFCYDRNDPQRGLYVVFHNPVRAACAALGYACEVIYHPHPKAAVDALGALLAAGERAMLHAGDDWVVVEAHAAGDTSRGDSRPFRARYSDGRCEPWSRSQLEQAWVCEPGLLELGLEGYYYLAIGAREREPDEREAAMGSLRRGVRMLLRRSRIDGCAAGLAAYQELLDSLTRKHANGVHQARAVRKFALWTARPLIYVRDSRRAASDYMLAVQSHFDDETIEHLRKASDFYRQAAQALAEVPVIEAVPDAPDNGAELGRAERKQIRALLPLRRRAARSLRRARKAEEQALTEIRRALESAERQDKDRR